MGILGLVVVGAVRISSRSTSDHAIRTGRVARFAEFDYAASPNFNLGGPYDIADLGWGSNPESQRRVAAEIATVHAHHPGERILLYMAPDAKVGDPGGINHCVVWDGTDPSGLPSSEFLTSGPQHAPIAITNKYGTSYPLNPASEAAQAACIKDIEHIMSAGGYDGVFLDGIPTTLSQAQLSAGQCDQTSVCGSASDPTQADAYWRDAMKRYLRAIAAAIHTYKPGALVIANIGGGAATQVAPAYWRAYLSTGIDGAMEESFIYGTDHQPLGPEPIATELSNIAWDETRGKLTLLNGDIRPVWDRRANTLALAMMMMVANGHTQWVVNNGNYAVDPPGWQTSYAAAQRIGAPLGAYLRSPKGLFVRRFVKGVVVANPTGSAITEPKFGTYQPYSATIGGAG